MLSFWTLSAALAAYLVVSSILSFSRNLRNARKTGLPIVVSPVDHMNPLWVIFQKPLGPLLAKLPFGLGSWVRYNRLSWYFEDKYAMFQEHGKVFIHVTPGMNELHSVDPEVNSQILGRRKDFEKPEQILKSVILYGDSITSVTGSEWQRHRRITAPPFNERNCRLVWDESLNQAGQLATYWSSRGSQGTTPILEDTSTVSLNVLATSALGKHWRFRGAGENVDAEGLEDSTDSVAYKSNLRYLLQSIRFLVLTPLWVYSLPLSVLPGELKKFVSAHREFEKLMTAMVKDKKAEVASAAGQISDATFLNTLVAKSEEFRQQDKPPVEDTGIVGGLSDGEIMGNLFVYNFAGHETTAGALNYALHLLAIFPKVQDWAREEVMCVYDQCTGPNGTAPTYETAFPQLKRCLSVMYETLRLYSPVHSVNKGTVGQQWQQLVIEGRSVLIPPNTKTNPNIIGSATLPEYWGEDHLEWKPSRWNECSNQIQALKTRADLDQEALVQPPRTKGAFIPWSGGARVCPGKKFSQVEFVAVISTLLRDYQVEVVTQPGESLEQARKRCLEIVDDSETQVILGMKRAKSVKLRLVEL